MARQNKTDSEYIEPVGAEILSPTEIQKLSGEDLNRAVAQVVYGYHEEGPYWVDPTGIRGLNCIVTSQFKPSEDRALAEQVAQKLRQKFRMFLSMHEVEGGWWVTFRSSDTVFEYMFGRTVAEGICRAAILTRVGA